MENKDDFDSQVEEVNLQDEGKNTLDNGYINIGRFRLTTANHAIEDAIKLPDPVDLYLNLLHEGEVGCLYADTNVGKSTMAVQIAEYIAEQRRILYVDCELAPKQFQLRYTDEQTQQSHKFPPGLIRADESSDNIVEVKGNYEESIIKDIEECAIAAEAKIIIIDNLTYLCLAAEDGNAAALLMMRLLRLKKQYGWTILVIAHTPKRQLWTPLTINDLAGSKKLANFFDTIFAIGRCRHRENLRYVKQLKVRGGEFTYTDKNVLLCEITKAEDGFLHFEPIGFASEYELLDDEDKLEVREQIQKLYDEGKTIREIAKALDVSKSTVGRAIKNQTVPEAPVFKC